MNGSRIRYTFPSDEVLAHAVNDVMRSNSHGIATWGPKSVERWVRTRLSRLDLPADVVDAAVAAVLAQRPYLIDVNGLRVKVSTLP